jgi:hypothetical protein
MTMKATAAEVSIDTNGTLVVAFGLPGLAHAHPVRRALLRR